MDFAGEERLLTLDDESMASELFAETFTQVEQDRVKTFGDFTFEGMDKFEPDMDSVIDFSSSDTDFLEQPPEGDMELTNDFFISGWIGGFHFDKVVTWAIKARASDIYINVDKEIRFLIDDESRRVPKLPVIDKTEMYSLITCLLSHKLQSVFALDREVNASYTLRHGPFRGRRLRLSVGIQKGHTFIVARVISDEIPSLDDLEIEEELVKWSKLKNGGWLVCGQTGSGKSTTLASLLRNVQKTESKIILTLEKPIEYIYPDDTDTLITQREVGVDSKTFVNGLDGGMRQSPHIILIGEIRNTEEVEAFLLAIESGHLTISTMHTSSASVTINRIQALFSVSVQATILERLSKSLRGIMNQVLVRKPGGGRFACREILPVNPVVAKMIENGDVFGIRKYQVDNEITMEHSLVKAYMAGKCDLEEARSHSVFPNDFDEILTRKTSEMYVF